MPALRRSPAHRFDAAGLPGTRGRMRTMFVLYALIIVAGLAYFTVIGLTHH